MSNSVKCLENGVDVVFYGSW